MLRLRVALSYLYSAGGQVSSRIKTELIKRADDFHIFVDDVSIVRARNSPLSLDDPDDCVLLHCRHI